MVVRNGYNWQILEMVMKVLHVVKTLAATSIPIEIASAVNALPDVQADIVVLDPKTTKRPDTVSEDCTVHFVEDLELLKNLIAHEGYDLINFHHHVFSNLSRDLLRELKKDNQRPVIIDTQHGHLHYSPQQKRLNLPGLRLSDGIIFNSYTTAASYNWLEKILMFGKPTRAIQLGVNLDLIDRCRDQNDNPTSDELVLAVAARLIPRKNLETLIAAVGKIKDRPLKLKIIGGGRSEQQLKDQVSRLELVERVEFTGAIPKRTEVYRHLANADAFVMPSFAEGFCVAVAEAMAMGLPVVASNIKTLKEVLGDNGIYFNPHSSDELAKRLIWLLENKEQWREIGARNRERAVQKFSSARTASEYSVFYKQLLGSKR